MRQPVRPILRAVAFAACMFFPGVIATGAARAASCPRVCLKNTISVYLDAMLAHDPARLPLAANARFTENSIELKPGEGLWKTVTRQGGFRQDYLDTGRGIAASHVVLYEAETPVIYTVVLHLQRQKIAGIETLAFRIPPDANPRPNHLDSPPPGMNDPVPASGRISRAAMIRIAQSYVEGLRVGSFVQSNTPFAPEAYRMTNGVLYAGGGCVAGDCNMQTQKITTHPDIKSSVAAVDREAGIVLLWMNLGDTGAFGPNTALVTFQAFKIHSGSIHAMNVFRALLPKQTQRGWPPVR